MIFLVCTLSGPIYYLRYDLIADNMTSVVLVKSGYEHDSSFHTKECTREDAIISLKSFSKRFDLNC